jgi:ORF6N domain
MSEPSLLVAEHIASRILVLRRQKVMLDGDLAKLYGVAPKVLNQAVRRNAERFPEDFMFQLTEEEALCLRSQSVTSNKVAKDGTSRGGRRYLPYAFTEHGVAMLSAVLRSSKAIAVSIEIMRTFVRLRHLLATHEDLARKLEELESKVDTQFTMVFDALHELMAAPMSSLQPIGFRLEPSSTSPQAPTPER